MRVQTIVALVAVGLASLGADTRCEAHRILGVFPLPARSHFGMFGALMKGLASRGHQVDVVGSFPLTKAHPNYTDIVTLPIERSYVNNVSYELISSINSDLVHFVTAQVGNKLCKWLGHPKIREMIERPPTERPYDLLITELFVTHCFLPLGPRLNVPTIALISGVMPPWSSDVIGNPRSLAFVPNSHFDGAAPMTFWQRLRNAVHSFYLDLKFHYYIGEQSAMMKKYFGDGAPGPREAERNLALILVNSHPSVNGAQPVTHAVVEVGGLHVRNEGDDDDDDDDDDELSRDLAEWMDNSTEGGFVYFTFGSMINIDTFPASMLEAFFKSFRKIEPTRVLMKVSNPDDPPAGVPSNVRTFRWAPQLKILRHKNVRAFITHGGLMGTQEAIHCAVPMIGVPQFSDQFSNVATYVEKKIAVKLNREDITERTVDEALAEILHNPVYKNTILKISAKFRDRPMSPMETAVWWVEYVVRHGNDALRSSALELAWWQVELLDVYAALTFVLALVVVALREALSLASNISTGAARPMVRPSKKVN